MTRVRYTVDSLTLQLKLANVPIEVRPPDVVHHRPLIHTIYTLAARWTASDSVSTVSTTRNGHRGTVPAFCAAMPTFLTALLDIHENTKATPEIWTNMLRHANLTSMETQQLCQFLERKSKTRSTACSPSELNFVQSLGMPLFQFLLANPHMVSLKYTTLWKAYPDIYGSFVPLNVQHTFEQRLQCMQTYTWETDQGRFTMDVLLSEYTIDPYSLDNIRFRIYVMAALQDKKEWHCKHTRVQWLPSSRRKLLYMATCSRESETCTNCYLKWNSFQINTGATYRHTCDTLTIWRKEEPSKTFLHELMHAFSFDFHDDPGTNDWMQRHFAIEPGTSVLFFEAYVETWATILNVYSIGAQNQLDDVALSTLLAHEIKFVLWQVAKILFHSGFQTIQTFFKRDCGQTVSKTKFKQTTSVLSYFIIRSIHLWNVEWFMQHFPHPRLQSCTAAPTQVEWRETLLTFFEQPSYQQAINTCIAHYAQTYHTAPSSFLCTTMRMTLFET
jgi:hypothetical protein